jgi:hypothetical protein
MSKSLLDEPLEWIFGGSKIEGKVKSFLTHEECYGGNYWKKVG